jgi:hypothetical protein
MPFRLRVFFPFSGAPGVTCVDARSANSSRKEILLTTSLDGPSLFLILYLRTAQIRRDVFELSGQIDNLVGEFRTIVFGLIAQGVSTFLHNLGLGKLLASSRLLVRQTPTLQAQLGERLRGIPLGNGGDNHECDGAKYG